MSKEWIDLDGSAGEGGGQILRSSLALALLSGKPFRLHNIRARRPKPGLQPQHLMCVQAAAAIGQAQTRGASRGSSELSFEPGEVVAGKYHFAIGTAGATALVLQTVYLPLMLCASAASEVVISGGTHNEYAPCFHFLDTTWRAYLETFGMRLKLAMHRPGFYPRGGGTIRAILHPCDVLHGFIHDAATPVEKVSVLSAVADLPEHIAERQAHRAENRFKSSRYRVKVKVVHEHWENGPGTVLALTLDTSPAPTLFFALGERGKKAERVADEAAEQALDYLAVEPPPVDLHSADQIVLPLALARGRSVFAVQEVTQHLLTNMAVIQRFIERQIICEGEEGKPGRVIIE
jgi:RNA 3'-terminal phosphate cyclase (ATP)